MYVGRYESQRWGSAPVVTIRGSHLEPEPAALSLGREELAALADGVEDGFSRPALAASIWEELGVPRALLLHAIREAVASDFVGGVDPERWSPMGEVRPEWLYRWRGLGDELELPDHDGRPRLPDLTPVVFNEEDMTGGPVIGFASDGLGVGALGVAWDSFLVPLPEGVRSLEIRFDEEASPQRLPSAADVLAAAPLGELEDVVCWRLYTGENSVVQDLVTGTRDGAHRLVRATRGAGGVVVGRVLRAAAGRTDSTRGDPRAGRRRFEAELAHQDIANACPDIDDEVTACPSAVVVVHGTMSTGLALAQAAAELAPTGCPVRRYEHDTWVPLESNAKDLEHLINLRVTRSVVLVGHSRGGLVATRAAQLLEESAPGLVRGVLTLGSPFHGTPLAEGATLGAHALRALMGGLRMVGGPAVDAATRLMPLAVRFDPPPGLTVMRRSAGELPYLRQYMIRPTTVVAGNTTDPGQDYHGPFSQGLARGAFRDAENDLVVSVESALGDRTDGLDVGSDHYSYLSDRTVRILLRNLILTL